MTGGKLISVIVPIYNMEDYITVCVDSLLHQTYPELEIILVDDGSKDRSGAICDSYAKADERVRVIHKENGGLSDARNAGMRIARGAYLGFVDSDDWADPNLFSRLYDALIQKRCQIAVCGKKYACNDGHLFHPCTNDTACRNYNDGALYVMDEQEALLALARERQFQSHAWGKLFCRSVWEGIFFPKGKYYEDIYIMHRVFSNASRIAFLDQPLYYYRRREDSIVRMKNMDGVMDCLEALAERYHFFEEKPQYQAAVSESIYRKLYEGIKWLKTLHLDRKTARAYRRRLNGYYARYCKENYAAVSLANLKRIFFSYFPGPATALLLAARSQTPVLSPVKRLAFRLASANSVGTDEKTLASLQNNRQRQRVILLGSPEGNNLGDLAIACAIRDFFARVFPTHGYYEFSERYVMLYLRRIKRQVRKDDLIVLTGGGNFGDFYMDQQRLRLFVLQNFTANPIVQFPQSYLFTKTPAGEKQLQKTRRRIGRADRLKLFAREPLSLLLFRDAFGKKEVELVPDIVLWEHFETAKSREGILVCLRGDEESVLSIEERNRIVYTCLEYADTQCWDTFIGRKVSLENRDEEVKKGIRFLGSHRLVVTDRLHGVIFSAITGTPCVALSNSNQKIRGMMELLKEMDGIRLLTDRGRLGAVIQELLCRYPDGFKQRISEEDFQPLRMWLEETLS